MGMIYHESKGKIWKWYMVWGISDFVCAVFYHETKQKFTESISNNTHYPRYNNEYEIGIHYLSKFEIIALYSDIFIGLNGKESQIIFQNSLIKKPLDKGQQNNFWYIENPKNIRPYLICIRKVK